MSLPILTPRIDRLESSGAFRTAHPGGLLGRLRGAVVLLPRDSCTFSLCHTAALPKSRRRQAARLQARLASPYLVSGAILTPVGEDFGIWWWDMEKVLPAVTERYGAKPPMLRPETLSQPAGEGWRIVELEHGYEAQFWRRGALAASAWRSTPFDPTAWANFTSVLRDESAPVNPPPAQSASIALDSKAFGLASSEVTRDQAIAAAMGGFALAACAFAAFSLGQGVALDRQIEEVQAETQLLRGSTPALTVLAGLQADQQRLADFQQIEDRTNPLTAAGAAIGIVALHDLTPSAIDAGDGELTITLPYTAVRIADELIVDFETSGYFHDVRPRTEAAAQTLVIAMKVRDAAPPLSAGG